ncbi:hypothetical protein RJ639_040791 [Escallonia herrerae]|uniref:Fe2OG dioxygenase domain-containing protein n=1 Tax=Escallonia herrerae TaxID=1293975 RepID=A0AA88WH42_9ASTE|nr:hypothetical protein RJ639_040791 [Escallonia herrerae]
MLFENYDIQKYYDSHIESTTYLLRLLKHRGPQRSEDNVAIPPHTDKSFFTILHQNEVDGLHVKTKDGQWIAVEFPPSSFVVMAGDACMVRNTLIPRYVSVDICPVFMSHIGYSKKVATWPLVYKTSYPTLLGERRSLLSPSIIMGRGTIKIKMFDGIVRTLGDVRLWDPVAKKRVISRDVVFNEAQMLNTNATSSERQGHTVEIELHEQRTKSTDESTDGSTDEQSLEDPEEHPSDSWNLVRDREPLYYNIVNYGGKYMALTEAAKEALWLKGLCDNQSALDLAKNQVFHARTKHIDVHYHRVREWINSKEIVVHKVHTNDNAADMFTKTVTTEKWSVSLPLKGMQGGVPEEVCSPHHRVIMTGEQTSYSMALFSFVSKLIQAPEELVDKEHPLRYKPFDQVELLKYYHTEEGHQAENTVKAFCGV